MWYDYEILFEDQDNILENNLYTYCFNNPTNYEDSLFDGVCDLGFAGFLFRLLFRGVKFSLWHSEVRRACKEFAAFLRKEYFFPLRVVIYVKKHYRIIALDGDRVCGTFRSTYDDYTVEPYILLAAGDYNDLCKKRGKDNALAAILLTMAHELTHYFQWINSLKLTPIGQERQATKYAGYLLDELPDAKPLLLTKFEEK